MTSATYPLPKTEPITWKGLPLLGPLFDIRRSELETFEKMAAVGDAVFFQVLHRRLHLLNHPDHYRHVLIDAPKNYRKQTRGYHFMRTVVGNGLLTSEGEFWLRQRRIASPAFHRNRIATFADTMVRAAQRQAELWRDGEVRDVCADMMRTTLDIVGRTLLSRDLTGDASAVGEALGVGLEHIMWRVRTPWALPQAIPTPRNVRFGRAVRELDRVVAEILLERRDGIERGDLLDMLMASRDPETGEGMTATQLRDEVLTILLAGHETTAMNLTWTLWLLAEHPEIQDRLTAEIDTLGGCPATMADLANLPYSDRVIHETLRLYPPAWVIARSAVEDDTIAGHPVKGGDWVFLSPLLVHRRPDFWPDPMRFDPDRFLPEQVEQRHRQAWIPFSAGSRKCIGDQFALMEARLVLITLLQHFRIESAGENPVMEPVLTLRPKGGLRLRLRSR